MGQTKQEVWNTVVKLACFAAVVLFLVGVMEGVPWLWRHL